MGKAALAVRRMNEADDLFDRIGAFLADHRLSPEPEHYAFAHSVLSRPDSLLAREVERLTEGGVRLSRTAIEMLGGQVASGGTRMTPREEAPAREQQNEVEDQAQRLVAETQAQVDGFAVMMRAMQDETRGFGQDLAQSAAAIVRVGPERAPGSGVSEIAQIAGVMIERVRLSEEKLARATAETDALRAKLVEAQATARRDPLSGLANRLAFAEGFAHRDASAGPHCIALCDVDRFKRINDVHGHGVGDRVLKAIARSLSEAFDDHLVARHGGEEFAILVSGADLAEATAQLDVVRATVAAKRFRDRETGAALGTISFSGGVTVVQAGESLEAALERADRLLYDAKAQGRDQIRAG